MTNRKHTIILASLLAVALAGCDGAKTGTPITEYHQETRAEAVERLAISELGYQQEQAHRRDTANLIITINEILAPLKDEERKEYMHFILKGAFDATYNAYNAYYGCSAGYVVSSSGVVSSCPITITPANGTHLSGGG